MSLWCNMNQEQGQHLANIFSQYRPFVGRVVRVDGTRRTPKKHIGKIGVVFWHGGDQYANAFRYGDSTAHAAIECRGRWGYRVGIKTDDGEKIFVGADDVMVAVPELVNA